jgi:predicted 2-oxoglutarate/Fe(II)-dependent dioxygenase YbiX
MLDCKITNSKINLVKPGTRMRMHTHYYDDAYACLYFTDTEDGDGGELVLHDPRWQKNYFFAGRADVLVPSKRGLLVVAPSFLWHEVLEYHGRKDRWTYVVHGTIERVK